ALNQIVAAAVEGEVADGVGGSTSARIARREDRVQRLAEQDASLGDECTRRRVAEKIADTHVACAAQVEHSASSDVPLVAGIECEVGAVFVRHVRSELVEQIELAGR